MLRAVLIEFDHDCSEHHPCRGTTTWTAQSLGIIVFDDSNGEPKEKALLVKVFVGMGDVVKAFLINGADDDGYLVYLSSGRMFMYGAKFPTARNRYRVVKADLRLPQTLLDRIISYEAYNVYIEEVLRLLLVPAPAHPQ